MIFLSLNAGKSLLIKNKYNRIYIRYNSQRIIATYIYHQEEICKSIIILTLPLKNTQKYTILFHSSVFIRIKQHNVN